MWEGTAAVFTPPFSSNLTRYRILFVRRRIQWKTYASVHSNGSGEYDGIPFSGRASWSAAGAMQIQVFKETESVSL